jgi:protein transport protein SEC24
VYFSYRRHGAVSGHAIAFIVSGELVSGIQMQVLHRPLQDYLHLLVGSAGKYYPNFNGKITRVRFNLGPGAFIDSKAAIIQKTHTRDPAPALLTSKSGTNTILKAKREFSQSDEVVEPTKLVYPNAQSYGVSLWFRWTRTDTSEPQVIMRLSTTEPAMRADFQKPGDRALMLSHLTGEGGLQFSTYTLTAKDETKSPINYDCPIHRDKLEEWTFAYFAYDRAETRLQYYLKNDDIECTGNEAA